jgi:phosphoglycerate dehydrogenase-like enzyme
MTHAKAEFAVMSLLVHWRNLDRLSRQQMSRQWTRFSNESTMTGRSLLVLGSGPGADEFVELASCFDCDIARISYRDLPSALCATTFHDSQPASSGIDLKDFEAIIVTGCSERDAPVPIRHTDFEQMSNSVALVSIASRLPFDEKEVVAALEGEKIAFLAIDRDGSAELQSDSQLNSFGNVLLFQSCDVAKAPN